MACGVHHWLGMQDRGFTLVEVLVALAILCVAALGGIQLAAVATEMTSRARMQSTATGLASSRMEQLRSLTFEFDAAGLRVTDLSTDVSADPPAPGGAGLGVSASASLDGNVAGYVDFLDGNGSWIGQGTSPPPGTVFVRRWAIDAVDAGGDLLALQVLVRPVASGSATGSERVAGEVRLITLRARTRR
jgi:prepilin-type N-terminal cleavage/methylation domain-containing protein